MPSVPGSELAFDASLGRLERWYCRMFGVPIVGLRIRLRILERLLPDSAMSILDAGCGRGVISRRLAKRYPEARVVALDQNAEGQKNNQNLANAIGLDNCFFLVQDLAELDANEVYDLIVSVDNLEHIQDDQNILNRFFRAMRPGGRLVVHVPHYYRRWPVFKWRVNFDVPGHVRPGYHQAEIVERVRRAGFVIEKTGFSYGFLENLANNLSYWITRAEERNRLLYAAAFPILNAIAWCGQWSTPSIGAGTWTLARRPSALAPVQGVEEDG